MASFQAEEISRALVDKTAHYILAPGGESGQVSTKDCHVLVPVGNRPVSVRNSGHRQHGFRLASIGY